jgi:L-methionine (R)-S-oxide reductase
MESLSFSVSDRAARYAELVPQLESLFADEPDLYANLANAAAALKECLPEASWVGFYLRRGDQLVLGPFQGKVACVRIAMGRGVCGTAAAEARTVIVEDVEAFPGHIACDAGSRSEIVVPIRARDSSAVLGVIDVDSYQLAAFDGTDAAGLEAVAKVVASLSW